MHPAPSQRDSSLGIQAHRCFAGVAPENTVLAARIATERCGASWLEIDVRPTADGTPVCFHDPALDERAGSRGITDETGLVRDVPTDTVVSAEVLDSGATVPRLRTLLAALPDDVGCNLELKHPTVPGDDGRPVGERRRDQGARWERFVDELAPIVADAERPIVLSSSFEGALAAAAERVPTIPRAVVVEEDLDGGRATARRYDAGALNVAIPILLDAGAAVVASSHEEDLAINAYTARRWTTVRDLVAIGVDGVIADYPFLDVACGPNGTDRPTPDGGRGTSSVDDGLLDDL